VPAGQFAGDVGFVAPDQRRTLSLQCVEAGELLTIEYDQVSQRLLDDIERLRRAPPRALAPAPAADGP
jgi:hypothetical protein